MSNLFLPDGKGSYTQQVQRLELPPIEVPYHLREDLEANPKLEPAFYAAVQKAMNTSMNDPRTRLREFTHRAAKERIELCYMALVTMRYDMKFPLKKCFDLLPGALMQALTSGLRLDDEMVHAGRDPKWWKGPGGTARVDVPTDRSEDMALEPTDRMETSDDD